MDRVYRQIGEAGILPVITLEDPLSAGVLGKALIKGGLPVAEITFRAKGAADAIRIMKKENPEMLVGAGTVLSVSQAKEAIDAGAEFIVAPGFHKTVAEYVLDRNTVMIPGAMTPTEIEAVMELGIHIVKFFPAEAAGGTTMINALAGPYRDIKWIPTGGINEKNLEQYLRNENVLACGGTWMVKPQYIDDIACEKVTLSCRRAVQIKERASM